MCQVSLVTLGTSKNMKFRQSRNSTKFDEITRFRETIPTVKSVSSSEIQKKSGFLTEITVLSFLENLDFFSGFYKESHLEFSFLFCFPLKKKSYDSKIVFKMVFFLI